jgi:NAD(P)-dependent dehydrogenase (short-subunit alcohol dehydrogenase family)
MGEEERMGLLDGLTAVVTGGGTGIGLAVARRFHAEGASVAMCGRRRDVLEGAARAISAHGERVLPVPADLARDGEPARLVEAVLAWSRRIDVLVNSAGMMRFGTLLEAPPSQWEELFRINAWVPWRLMAAAAPAMRAAGGGSIVNISTISANRPFPGGGLYGASKAALQLLSQVMAMELAEDRIRVNVLCPGMVEDTELGMEIFGAEGSRRSYERFRSVHPLGRNGKPSDIAEAALFLASPLSSWITGAVVPIDGGRHMASNSPAP